MGDPAFCVVVPPRVVELGVARRVRPGRVELRYAVRLLVGRADVDGARHDRLGDHANLVTGSFGRHRQHGRCAHVTDRLRTHRFCHTNAAHLGRNGPIRCGRSRWGVDGCSFRVECRWWGNERRR